MSMIWGLLCFLYAHNNSWKGKHMLIRHEVCRSWQNSNEATMQSDWLDVVMFHRSMASKSTFDCYGNGKCWMPGSRNSSEASHIHIFGYLWISLGDFANVESSLGFGNLWCSQISAWRFQTHIWALHSTSHFYILQIVKSCSTKKQHPWVHPQQNCQSFVSELPTLLRRKLFAFSALDFTNGESRFPKVESRWNFWNFGDSNQKNSHSWLFELEIWKLKTHLLAMIFHGKCSNQGNVRLPSSPSKVAPAGMRLRSLWKILQKTKTWKTQHHPASIASYLCGWILLFPSQKTWSLQTISSNDLQHTGESNKALGRLHFFWTLFACCPEWDYVSPNLGGVAPKLGDSFGPQYLLGRIYNYHRHYLSYSSCCLFDCLVHFEVQQFWAIALK